MTSTSLNEMTDHGPRYLISIASYRRPDDLARLLDSLQRTDGINNADIIVVDNDPNETARRVTEAHPLKPRYLVEREPGIASARNRGLAEFSSDYYAIVFVDDDEWVNADWFSTLTEYQLATGVGVVTGPVITVLPENTPSWIIRGGFYQRPLTRTGTALLSAATNNTLLTRSSWITAGSPLFDTDFSSTGGSDWDFFWGIRKTGTQIRYCAGAVVSEDVPPSRLSGKWLRRRAVRNGIVNTRVRRKHGDPLVLSLTRGLARAGFNAVVLSLNLITGKGVQAKPLNAILNEYGKFSALVGYRIHEYRR